MNPGQRHGCRSRRTRRWRGTSPALTAGAGEEARSGGWNVLETRPRASDSQAPSHPKAKATSTPLLHQAVTQQSAAAAYSLSLTSPETLLCAELTQMMQSCTRCLLPHCQLWETRPSFHSHSLLVSFVHVGCWFNL